MMPGADRIVPLVQIVLCLPSLNGLIIFEGSMVLMLTAASTLGVNEALALCVAIRLIDTLFRALAAVSFLVPTHAARRASPDVVPAGI